MKKKLVVVLLSAAMCVAAFGGCGAKSDSSDSSSNKKTETSSKKEGLRVRGQVPSSLLSHGPGSTFRKEQTRRMNSVKQQKKRGIN